MNQPEDKRVNPHALPPARHNGQPLVDGEVSEDPLDIAAARWPKNSRRDIEEMFQFFDETMNSGDQINKDSLAQALRERDRQWFVSLGKMLSMLINYLCRQRDPHFMRMAVVSLAYAMDFKDQAGATSFAEIAKKYLPRLRNGKRTRQSGKATVHKCAEHFIEKLELAPMLSGRTDSAKAEMTAARLEKIKQRNMASKKKS
jgi:hypothetical protein